MSQIPNGGLFAQQIEVKAQRHSPTSVAAAKRLEPKVPGLSERVWRYLESRGAEGATDDELIVHFETPDARPRRIGLTDAGVVRDSGKTRDTRKGNPAVVWVASWPHPPESC